MASITFYCFVFSFKPIASFWLMVLTRDFYRPLCHYCFPIKLPSALARLQQLKYRGSEPSLHSDQYVDHSFMACCQSNWDRNDRWSIWAFHQLHFGVWLCSDTHSITFWLLEQSLDCLEVDFTLVWFCLYQKQQMTSKFSQKETLTISKIIAQCRRNPNWHTILSSIRGRLGAIQPLARNLGLLLSFSIGSIVEYKYWPFIFIWIPVVYLVLLLFLNNTPQYYLQKGNCQVRICNRFLFLIELITIFSFVESKGSDCNLQRMEWKWPAAKCSTAIGIRKAKIDWRRTQKSTENTIEWFLQSNGCEGDFIQHRHIMVFTNDRMLYFHQLCVVDFWKIWQNHLQFQHFFDYIGYCANFRRVCQYANWRYVWTSNNIG